MKETQLKEMIRFLETSEQKAFEKAKPLPCRCIRENIFYLDDHDPMHTLDILYPKQEQDQYPWIFYIHGGGFCMHSKDSIYRTYATHLANDEFAIVNINYRLAPDVEYHNILSDVLHALHYIDKQAPLYHLDPAQVFLAGDSAGAYLAAMCAAVLSHQKLKNKIPFSLDLTCRGLGCLCGMFDFQTFLEDKKVKFPLKKEIIRMLFPKEEKIPKESSILNYVTSAYPCVYLMDSAYKSFAEEARRFASVLDQHGVIYQQHLFEPEEKLRHNFQILQTYSQSDIVLHELMDFFHSLL